MEEQLIIEDGDERDHSARKVSEPSETDSLSVKQSYLNLKRIIKRDFSEYKWDKIKMENLCEETKQTEPAQQKQQMNYTNTQSFISEYFTPSLYNRGMLLWHSVGTGKTCTAVLTASKSFEREQYTIIWVTRSTLINDIWKNMFSQVCNKNVREMMEFKPLPAELNKQKKWLSASWKIPPLSYKQFTNLVSKKNKFYKMLEKINGTVDPLRKTLIIIDEAHKLYGESDLLATEQPNMTELHLSLMNSYAVSGENSAKLLLMTATPITKDPMELLKLLNLCRPIEDQFPENYFAFKQKYLNSEGIFEANRLKFLNKIAGYVSYLDRSNDIRQFSQPKLHYVFDTIDSNIIDFDKRGTNRLNKINKKQMDELNKEKKKQMIIFSKLSRKMKKSYRQNMTKKYKVSYNKIADIQDKKVKRMAVKEVAKLIKSNVTDTNEVLKNLKTNHKTSKFNKLTVSERRGNKTYKQTPYYNLLYKCGKSIISTDLKTYYDNDPKLIELNDSNKSYRANVDELKNKLKNEKKIFNSQIRQFNISVKNKIVPPIPKIEIEQSYKDIKRQDMTNISKLLKNIKQTNKLIKTRSKNLSINVKTNVTKKKKQNAKDFKELLAEIKKEDVEYSQEFLNLIDEQENKLKSSIDEILDDKIEAALKASRDAMEDKERINREKAQEKERIKREKAQEKAQEKERIIREREQEKERIIGEKAREKERIIREKAREKERIVREKEQEKERIKKAKEQEKERIKREKAALKTKKNVKGGSKNRQTRRKT